MQLAIVHSLPLSDPISICLNCPKMKLEVKGGGAFMFCTVDHQPIQSQAENLNCPEGYFKAGPGDRLKLFLKRFGIDQLYTRLMLALSGKPCPTGCDGRRKLLNKRFKQWEPFFGWLDGASWHQLTYCDCGDSKAAPKPSRWRLFWIVMAANIAVWAALHQPVFEHYHLGLPTWISDGL